MATEHDEHPDYRRIGWRRDVAKRICGLLNYGPNGLASVGIDAEEAVVDLLLEHRCTQDLEGEKGAERG